RVRKPALRITLCRNAARLDENRPAGPEPAQGVVEPRGGANELGRGCRIEIGSAEPGRALEAPILVEDHARCDERRPRQEIGKHSRFFAIFREVQHGVPPYTPRCDGYRRCRRTTSTNCASRFAAQTAAMCPIAQSTSPAIHRRSPKPI